MSKTRSEKIQTIRGLCIFAVILIHCKSLEMLSLTWESAIFLFYRNIINFPVAFFLFLSGYFSNCSNVRGYKDWYCKRIKRLIIPYTIWSTFYYIVLDIIVGKKPFSLLVLAKHLLIGDAVNPFYFIVLIYIFTLITPILLKILRSRFGIVCLIGTIALIEIASYFLQYNGINVFGTIMKYSPSWVAFYIFGILYNEGRVRMPSRNKSFYLVIFCLVLEMIESVLLSTCENTKIITFSQLKISGIFYSIFLICFFMKSIKEEGIKMLSNIGDYSYGIFYIHMFFVFVLNRIMGSVNMFVTIQNFLEGVFVLIASCLTIFIMKKILQNKKILKLIGF